MKAPSILPLYLVLLLALLAGCSHQTNSIRDWEKNQDGPPDAIPDIDSIPEPIPHFEAKSRYGNPNQYVVFGKKYFVMDTAKGYDEVGHASWYGTKFDGRRTSSGDPYDIFAMSAAHKTLPLPTFVEVTNLDNGKHTIVRVNDRGPFHEGRIIDLSYSAATKLDIIGKGTGRVRVRAITDFGIPSSTVATAKPTSPALRPAKVLQTPRSISPVDPPKLFLQVGAFSQEANAQQLVARLNAEAFSGAHVAQAQKNGAALYKVRIGPMESKQSADAATKKLSKININSQLIRE